MTNFANASHVAYRGGLAEKREALALDFLRGGKTIDFVLANVAGSDTKAQARLLSLAVSNRFISAVDKSDQLKKRKIDEQGRKVR